MLISRSVFGYHVIENNRIVKTLESLDDLVVDDEVETDSEEIYLYFRNHVPVRLNSQQLDSFRRNKYTLLEEAGIVSSWDEYYTQVRNYSIQSTRLKVREAAEGKDVLVSQTVQAIDDINKMMNNVYNRLRELYDIHFPELSILVNNHATYARIIRKTPARSTFEKLELEKLGLNSANIEQILEAAKNSLGADLDENELVSAVRFAMLYIEHYTSKNQLEKWVESMMKEIAPNLAAVAGSMVGAKLIAKAGSLRQLAMKPSSKIQTLGAEKALYSAMKKGGSTPKHGIIFQIPDIGISPFWIRGKLSRAYASKIAIAARLDEFKGEFLGDKYKEELSILVDDLKKKHPNPPPRKKKQPRKQGKQRFNQKKRRKGGRK